ncbi:hypothetical protein L9F63_013785 [Diploptera punctata]|uniref:Uncharacterized protein n=1 Tax=Diploptera punctata TaxID=6984 RepID=A0AAD8ELD1_DIPPU|nr:hypothetical protein L9F63_013785 [Diploptera punctata]
MLDIYPMMEDSQPQASSNKVRPRGRPPGHGFGHVRFPHSERGRLPPDQVAESSETKHQMIVHLNLYPKKKKQPSISSRNDDIPTYHVDVTNCWRTKTDIGERFGRGGCCSKVQ